MDVQQRGAGGVDAAAQRRLDVLDVVESLCAVQIDDQVHACAAHAITNGKMIVTILRQQPEADTAKFGLPVFLPGGTWISQALHRSQEGVLAHAVFPNQRSEPEMPASRRRGMRRPPDHVHTNQQQRPSFPNKCNQRESRRFCKKTFNASSRSTVQNAPRRRARSASRGLSRSANARSPSSARDDRAARCADRARAAGVARCAAMRGNAHVRRFSHCCAAVSLSTPRRSPPRTRALFRRECSMMRQRLQADFTISGLRGSAGREEERTLTRTLA